MNVVFKLTVFFCCTAWCTTSDNQYMTTFVTSDDETDSEMSATLADNFEFNTTTSTAPTITTMNEYLMPNGGVTLPRDRMGAANSHHLNHKDKPKSTEENIINRAPLASTSSSVTEPSLTHSVGAIAKPTKYHYYPHNQHMYLLPECAVQQVCSAVYVRLNYTQPLCACPSRYREPCSASLNSDDLHTTELSVDSKGKVLTLVKTCEPVKDMRLCRTPRDWSLLALQNVRTGKSHYLVICHCPDSSILEGPATHDQPTYASVPGIKVYGMVCVSKPDSLMTDGQTKKKTRFMKYNETVVNEKEEVPFPFHKIKPLLKYVNT